jgi:folate-binding protein YgfZ
MEVFHSQETSLSMFSLEGYQALRAGAGAVRRGDRGVIAVTGADRLTWLQGLLTNDVSALPVGGVCDAAYLTPQGRMITDMRVLNLAERTLLDVPGSLAEGLAAKLDGLLFSEDAQVENVSRRTTLIDVHGPTAPAIIDKLGDEIESAGAIVADAAFGVPGFTVVVPSSAADHVFARITDIGATAVTLETLDVLRVEAGRPAFLVDMDEHTIPLEAGLEKRAISFTKGCYVGQEVIVRIMQRGHGRVAKKLVGLLLEGSDLPKQGDVIQAADRDVGMITSTVWSPALQRGIALGYVRRDATAVGTSLLVRSGARTMPAEVSSLPFVDGRVAK